MKFTMSCDTCGARHGIEIPGASNLDEANKVFSGEICELLKHKCSGGWKLSKYDVVYKKPDSRTDSKDDIRAGAHDVPPPRLQKKANGGN